MYCLCLRSKNFRNESAVLKISYWEFRCGSQMTDEDYFKSVDKIVFNNTNQIRWRRICLGQVSGSSMIVFLTKLFVNLLLISGCYRKFIFQKLLTNQMFGWEFCVVQQHSFWHGQDYALVKFFESSSLFFIGSTVRDCEISNLLLLNISLRNSTKVWQILPFLSKFPASLPCYTKRKWESHVCSRCKLWNTRFLEKKTEIT